MFELAKIPKSHAIKSKINFGSPLDFYGLRVVLKVNSLLHKSNSLHLKAIKPMFKSKMLHLIPIKCRSKRRSVSVSLISQVTTSACLQKLANRFAIYESKIRSSLRPSAPRTTYLNQISSHLLPVEKALVANKIRKMVLKISEWSHLFVVSKK